MSIAVMEEGDMMGRGIPPDRKLEAKVRARLKSQAPNLIAVLGAGPAGLLAAHAIALAGGEPAIFSKGDPLAVKSAIGPATYLHKAIPDLTGPEPDAMIRFVKVGTAEGYAAKVYGSANHPTSWDKFEEGEQAAWDLGTAYDSLWERYADRIIPMEVNAEVARLLLDDFGAVVSTVPLHALCEEDHAFPHRAVWVTDQFTFHDGRDPLMVYDGHPGTARFRSSRVFGKCSTEYAERVVGARQGIKVMETDCDCHPEIVRAGRWGEWKPGVLTHHAFEKVWSLMFDNFEGA